jgi:hypothetical protein
MHVSSFTKKKKKKKKKKKNKIIFNTNSNILFISLSISKSIIFLNHREGRKKINIAKKNINEKEK